MECIRNARFTHSFLWCDVVGVGSSIRYLLWMAHRFYMRRDTTSARKLFFASLIYLPLQMALMMLHKSNHPASRAAAVATPSLSL